jgi:hypothetical protein
MRSQKLVQSHGKTPHQSGESFFLSQLKTQFLNLSWFVGPCHKHPLFIYHITPLIHMCPAGQAWAVIRYSTMSQNAFITPNDPFVDSDSKLESYNEYPSSRFYTKYKERELWPCLARVNEVYVHSALECLCPRTKAKSKGLHCFLLLVLCYI